MQNRTMKEVKILTKEELIKLCTTGEWNERKKAVNQLRAFDDEDVRSLINTIAVTDISPHVKQAACQVENFFRSKHSEKPISHKTLQKRAQIPSIKKLIPKEKTEKMIDDIYEYIKSKDIPYDNKSAFKVFAETAKELYPSEFDVFSSKFSLELNGMRNYFERMPTYNKRFIAIEKLSTKEKVFRVFDVERVGYRTRKLKYTQLKHCMETFKRLYPGEWDGISKTSTKSDFKWWLQA